MNKFSFEHSNVGNVTVHVLPTSRFKTFAVSLYAGTELQEDTVTNVALSPFVLRRGTESHPESIQFKEQLEHLYGAGFGFDVYKRGNYQIVQFQMDTINDAFVNSEESLLEKTFEFLGEVVTKPALENGAFRESYVQAEKDNVKRKLESIINDKIRYSAERCLEEMFRNDPYRLHPLGNRESIDSVTPQSLYEAYDSWLKTCNLDLYVVGDTTLQEVEELVKRYFKLDRKGTYGYSHEDNDFVKEEVRHVEEKLDVNQGKLNLGLRTPIRYGSDQYAAALVYNGILGSYPHSKLFINVREKASLAYYAASRLDGHKGFIGIGAGIEIANYEQALTIITAQLEALRNGDISETEMVQTKAMIRNSLLQLQDSAYEMISFDFNSVLSGKDRSAKELLEEVEKVTVEDVVAVANTVHLDTIYFLTGQKEG